MMKLNDNQQEFLELVRAGLFPDRGARILAHGTGLEWDEIYRLAEEQSIIGLVAAGIDGLPPSDRPQPDLARRYVGVTLQLEQRNKAMNAFIANLMKGLQSAGIHSILVKGQGIAQCYEKPLWRTCGDVDLLLDADNYEKAKSFLMPIASRSEVEDKKRKHLGLTVDEWIVELHGTLHNRLLKRVNNVVDEVQREMFLKNRVRIWENDDADVYLPAPNEDAMFVFSHIVQHFWGEGIGLRQICDWCRLLWTYRESLDTKLLEQRLNAAGLMTEWKAFGSLAVDYLGLPEEAMPFCDLRFKAKGLRLLTLVLETGNFGHNRDVSYRKGNVITRKTISFCRYTKDTIKRIRMFPLDSLQVWGRMVVRGVMKR